MPTAYFAKDNWIELAKANFRTETELEAHQLANNPFTLGWTSAGATNPD